MPTTAILGTKALVCGTWGQAATMPTMPASAFCGRIPRGIQLLRGRTGASWGPKAYHAYFAYCVTAKGPVTLACHLIAHYSLVFLHIFSVTLYCFHQIKGKSKVLKCSYRVTY